MGTKRPRRPLRPDEKALWEHVTRAVRPKSAETPAAADDPDHQPPGDDSRPRKRPPRRRVLPAATPPAPSKAPPDLTHGSGMDRRTAQRLKRGQLDIEARIDLHGHTQAAAHRALESFLHAAHQAGRRTVLVITGKGDGLGGRPGVLKQTVPRWLGEMPMRQWVAGFSYAAPKDGGEGALYVRVKRRKGAPGP